MARIDSNPRLTSPRSDALPTKPPRLSVYKLSDLTYCSAGWAEIIYFYLTVSYNLSLHRTLGLGQGWAPCHVERTPRLEASLSNRHGTHRATISVQIRILSGTSSPRDKIPDPCRVPGFYTRLGYNYPYWIRHVRHHCLHATTPPDKKTLYKH